MRGVVLFVAGAVLSIMQAAAEPVNLALGKPYTMSPRPKYKYSTDPGDKVQLTDGKHVGKYGFLTDKLCVGWNKIDPVIVIVDLGKNEPICGGSWSTAAGRAGVTWPSSIMMLVSENKKEWRYLGDLRNLGDRENELVKESFVTYKFTSDKFKDCGRYVAFVVSVMPYCLVDEVEVWQGKESWLNETFPQAEITDLLKYYNLRRTSKGVAIRLNSDLATILQEAQHRVGDAKLLQPRKQEIDAIQLEIAKFVEHVTEEQLSVIPCCRVHERILALNSIVLQSAGITAPLVWQSATRWDPLSTIVIPDQEQRKQVAGIAIDMMRNEVRGEAFNITNPGKTPLKLRIKVERIPAALNLEMREVVVTDTRDNVPIMAALKPMQQTGENNFVFQIPAGCTRQVWLSVKRSKAAPGSYQGYLQLSGGDNFIQSLPLNIRLRNIELPDRLRLHVGGWDYVHGDANHFRAPGNLESNLALMRDHYVDSPWARNQVFPYGVKFDNEGKLTNESELDFACWDEWVTRWHGARNYCVFFSAKDNFHGEPMGSKRFNNMVASWLGAWVKHIKAQGLNPAQLVILLLDEPHRPEQDDILIAWARAVRAANLGVTLFIDPTYRKPEDGKPEMYALHDILCPHTPMMITEGQQFRNFYLKQKAAGRRLWLYSCAGPAKLLDPINYHRAQPWVAFQIGAQGSFYWALGCGGRIGDSWHAYRQTGVEYSPYFVAPDSVMEGKHSEALREGVQDFELFSMLKDKLESAKHRGDQSAWITDAEILLSDGIAGALESLAPDKVYWNSEKDRSGMDKVRMQAMNLLETKTPSVSF